MLVIRAEQMKALADSQQRLWMIDYLVASYPEKARELGVALSQLVETAAKQATSRGFEDPEEILKYVHVAFLLGEGFEANPSYAWAAEILDSPKFKNPRARLRALEDAALKSLKAGSQ
jgi:hypothetical protein